MVTEIDVKKWLAREYGWRVLDPRVRDVGYAFHVSDRPDEEFFGPRQVDPGWIIVIKRTGAVWRFGWHPTFQQIFDARDEVGFNQALADLIPGKDPATPDTVIRQGRMLSMAALEDWLAHQYGWREFDGRITDIGYAYAVSTHPDAYHAGDQSAMTYGNGPLIVIKRTGALWGFGSNPIFLPVFEAQDEQSFDAAVAAAMPGRNLAQPDAVVSVGPELSLAALQEYLTINYGFRVFDGRITDNGWAYVVNPQADDVLRYDLPGMQGVGPIIVIKRTGAVWQFGSNNALHAALDEDEFYRLMREQVPSQDPRQPRKVVPAR